jgi:curved DNA-binding protein CbpA
MKDYYYILGVNKTATSDEIKKAYRKLSMKFHPDKNQGDSFFEERFKEIQEAYEVLADSIKRSAYNAHYSANTSGGNAHQFVNFAEQIKREYEERLRKLKGDLDKKDQEFRHKEKQLNEKINEMRRQQQEKAGSSRDAAYKQQIIDELRNELDKERVVLQNLKAQLRHRHKIPALYKNAFFIASSIIVIMGISLFVISKQATSETIRYVVTEKDEPDFEHSISTVELLNTVDIPIVWDSTIQTAHGQKAYVTYPATSLNAKVFTNNGFRSTNNIQSINNVVGVNHFFMDHDLVSGYVHPYTQNFFDKLRPDDFVGRFEWSGKEKNTGVFGWVQKKELSADDKLGQNLAFFRQWKLSEIAVSGTIVNIQPCTYKRSCKCMQVLKGLGNPFETEVPIPSTFALSGYQPLAMLNKLDQENGGTAAIIWLDGKNNVTFMDVHGSIELIIAKAREIAAEFNTDPTIAVGDAGPYSKKYYSNNNYELNFAPINALSRLNIAGAGMGYIPAKASKFRVTFKDGHEEIYFLPDHAKEYELFMQKSTQN